MVVLVLVERVRFHDYYAERRVQISSLDTSMTNRGGNSCMETKTNLGCNFLGRGGTTRITAIETWALRRYIWSMADNSLSLSLSLWWKQFSNYPPRLSTKFFEFDFIRGSPSLERSIKCDNFNRIIIISRRIRKSVSSYINIFLFTYFNIECKINLRKFFLSILPLDLS